jgi:ribose transport system substrate-binding protein
MFAFHSNLRRRFGHFFLTTTIFAAGSTVVGCHSRAPVTIAVIPRTAGTFLWEPMHVGAELAAQKTGLNVYWNAPTREDDIQGQITLLEKVVARGYKALILAPDHELALITPVRLALSHGLATVIVGSSLPIPAGGKLSYILNDDEEAGRLAARCVAQILQNKGSVIVLGIDPDIAGIMIRARSLEKALQDYPSIKIVDKRIGAFNTPYDQQIAEESLRQHPAVTAIVALTSTSTRGSSIAINHMEHKIHLVGFDDLDDLRPLREGRVDAIITQNSREMGFQAVTNLAAQLHGHFVPGETKIPPVMLTSKNVDSPETRRLLSNTWRSLQ